MSSETSVAHTHPVRRPLLAFGHGTANQDELTRLLQGAQVARVVDVRRHPGSRAHPHVRREELSRWLPSAAIEYRWEERLGGRRRVPADSPDVWWQVDAFRAYAGHMRTPEFLEAVDDLLVDAAAAVTAVMCSESVWWRCHRRLIADFVHLAKGRRVCHLLHSGRLADHAGCPGARVTADGVLVYDVLP